MINHQDALNALIAGNRRFVAMQSQYPRTEPAYRHGLVSEQTPFAAVLGCSDSRVPVEHVFDQGFGDLFVIRVAGNVSNGVVLGSLEFAVHTLNVSLIVVMGHSQCGAVKAAIDDTAPLGYLPEITERIRPAIATAQQREGDLLQNTVCTNAESVASQLTRQSGILLKAVQQDAIAIVPAYYDLASGKVNILANE